ncbi:MAG TPA: hypothetical protein VGM10_04970 [Actinocrinis sp.]|jgi:hypothetical protein
MTIPPQDPRPSQGAPAPFPGPGPHQYAPTAYPDPNQMSQSGATMQSAGWARPSSGGDIAYRIQTLRHQEVELGLDETVRPLVLFWLWLRAAIISVTVNVLFVFLWLIVERATLANTAGTGTGPSLGILEFGSLLSFVLYWVILLFSSVEEPIAEWRSLVPEKAAAATSSYSAIYGSLKLHRIPLSPVATRVRSDLVGTEVVNNRLVINFRGYTSFITVFPYGASLYVGWLMFRRRPGYMLIGVYLKDLVSGIFGRNKLVAQMLRTESVRAMREAIHTAVREGVDVAIQGIDVPMEATFGAEVPIYQLEAVAAGAAPQPGHAAA